MRRWVFTALLLCLLALAFPLAVSAGGWAGSRYDKSECTYTKATNVLYCETIVTTETFMTAVMSIDDGSCPTGALHQISRTGTFVEPQRSFEWFAGRTPHQRYMFAGNEEPLFGQEHWEDFTDTDLGCFG